MLGGKVKDYSQTPGLRYHLETESVVLAGDGCTWFQTPRAYIEHRLREGLSELPESERNAVCDMFVNLACAEKKACKSEKAFLISSC